MPLMFRRSLLGDDMNPQHHLDYSLVPGFRLRSHLETKAARRWRKPLGSSSFQDHLSLRTNPLLRKLLKILRRLRLLPRLHRLQRKTRNGGCVRSCESHSGYLSPLSCPPACQPTCILPHLEERIRSLSWYIWIPFPSDVRYAPTIRTSYPRNFHDSPYNLHPELNTTYSPLTYSRLRSSPPTSRRAP